MQTKEVAMRSVISLLMAAAVVACAPPSPAQTAAADARAQTRLNQLLTGKVAGRPQSCLPNWRAYDMVTIDDSTLVFRESPGRVWLQKPRNPCNLLSAGPYALVTRQTTGALCSGDISQVVDTMSGTNVGSCVMGDFVPYTRPGA
jgi:hypothetical protein